MKNQKSSQISIFNGNKIRKTLHQNEWWFVIQDIVKVLTDSIDPAWLYQRYETQR